MYRVAFPAPRLTRENSGLIHGCIAPLYHCSTQQRGKRSSKPVLLRSWPEESEGADLGRRYAIDAVEVGSRRMEEADWDEKVGLNAGFR